MNSEEVLSIIYEEHFNLSQACKFILKLRKELKKKNQRIDTFALSFFEGNKKIDAEKMVNKNLVVTLLLLFVWERLHRDVAWKESETWILKESHLSKIKNLVMRFRKKFDFAQEPLLIAIEILIKSVCKDYYSVAKLTERLRQIKYPENAFMYNLFRGAYSFNFKMTYDDVSYPNSLIYSFECLEQIRDNNDPIILVSCDQKYFDFFKDDFIHSARKYLKRDYNIIFAIVDGETGVIGDQIFTVAIDSNRYESCPALYATVRYLIAGDLLKVFKREILVFDIDYCFNNLVSQEINRLEHIDFDIGLCFNKKSRHLIPWCSIPAAATIFRDLNKSIEFLDYFNHFIFCSWNKKLSNWWIDQNALFYAYHMMRSIAPTLYFTDLLYLRDVGITNSVQSVKDIKANLGRK